MKPWHFFWRKAIASDSVPKAAILRALILEAEIEIFPANHLGRFVIVKYGSRPGYDHFACSCLIW